MTSEPNLLMERWFSQDLFPAMLKCEEEVKRQLASQTNRKRQRKRSSFAPSQDHPHVKTKFAHSPRRNFKARDTRKACDQDAASRSGDFEDGASSLSSSIEEVGFAPSEEQQESENALIELNDFLKQSLEHKKHLVDVRRRRKEEEAEYVMDTQGPLEVRHPSALPPDEQPGKSRFAALTSLYGDRATSIVAMETRLQSRFDRYVSASQPEYWPIIPFKF